jgi:hypothetical protein
LEPKVRRDLHAGESIRILRVALLRRSAAAFSVAVVLVGGAALAQSDLIVDPWQGALSGKAPARFVPDVSRPAGADDGWYDGASTSSVPRPVVEPMAPIPSELLADWPERAPRSSPLAPPPAPAPTANVPQKLPWARVVPEIVDPWSPRKLAVYRDPLIVDPWAARP